MENEATLGIKSNATNPSSESNAPTSSAAAAAASSSGNSTTRDDNNDVLRIRDQRLRTLRARGNDRTAIAADTTSQSAHSPSPATASPSSSPTLVSTAPTPLSPQPEIGTSSQAGGEVVAAAATSARQDHDSTPVAVGAAAPAELSEPNETPRAKSDAASTAVRTGPSDPALPGWMQLDDLLQILGKGPQAAYKALVRVSGEEAGIRRGSISQKREGPAGPGTAADACRRWWDAASGAGEADAATVAVEAFGLHLDSLQVIFSMYISMLYLIVIYRSCFSTLVHECHR